jgi:hypothetical protein
VGGGYENKAPSTYSSVSGGEENVASEGGAWVGGGYANKAEALDSSVSGGSRKQSRSRMVVGLGGRQVRFDTQYGVSP